MNSVRPLSERLETAWATARRALVAARMPSGHWEGELSNSALSTATAIIALSLVERHGSCPPPPGPVPAGLAWLATHANADGGWGDTTQSLSNISTTALCWAAFGAVPGADQAHRPVVERAEAWLADHSHEEYGASERREERGQARLSPAALARAIINRYGRDRTFSVPILTACALAGRLGSGRDAWRRVLPLPFELAAFPRQWFAALRLPVVSYALPALIAIGQARHVHRPTRNPFARLARALTRRRTLKILEEIQPSNGGFLEATPLTSFVVLSLAGSGRAEHPVTKKGVEFLLRSQRQDGSWAIDTNLATWLTTLSVNALAGPGGLESEGAGQGLCRWLLDQQYRQVHPYTQAAPGGWAWTDLPGGVPDADDTAGAVLALRELSLGEAQTQPESIRTAACAGIEWLLGLQNRDGGIPTFCRGWGALPFDRSGADLTAHALRAWLAWSDALSSPWQERIAHAASRALQFLSLAQGPDGSWIPLWFGNQFATEEENPTYGTSRVVRALVEAHRRFPNSDSMLARGSNWLLAAQNTDGGWGGALNLGSSVEESALAIEALGSLANCQTLPSGASRQALQRAVLAGAEWLVAQVESGRWKSPTPIGFYFAKLWYYERLYPQIFTVAALAQIRKLTADEATQ